VFCVRLLMLAILASLATASSHAADKAQLLIGVGQYDILPDDNKSAALHIQYRFAQGFGARALGPNFMGIKPLIGGWVNTDEGAFGFVGFAAPFQWGRGVWELEPSAGIGAHHQGDSTFLGGTAQFHLGLQLSARITPSARAGIGITHVSNAQLLHKKNRGTNVLMGTLAWEF
jgi:opacity protein-like surface antigen